jgi:hypothetical protein
MAGDNDTIAVHLSSKAVISLMFKVIEEHVDDDSEIKSENSSNIPAGNIGVYTPVENILTPESRVHFKINFIFSV